MKFAYYSATPALLLEWVPVEDLYRRFPDRSDSDDPCVISREGANFVFGPVSSDGTLNGIYYAKQDPLRTTDPSWYVTNAPEVLLYGALLESAPFIHNDERLPTWAELFKDSIDALMDEQDNAESSGGQLVQTAS